MNTNATRLRGEVSGAPAGYIVFRLPEHWESSAKLKADPRRAIFCRGDREFLAAVNRSDVGCFVWDVSRAMPARPASTDATIRTLARRVPLLLLADDSKAAIRVVASATKALDFVGVSHAQGREVDRELGHFVDNPFERGAEQAVIRRLLPLVQDSIAEIVFVGILAAKRRTHVDELARRCRVSTGTLLYRLKAARAPTPAELLACFTALHAAWWRGVMAWPSKRVAEQLGYFGGVGVVALDHFVRRHARVGLREMSDSDVFWRLLERSATEFDGAAHELDTSSCT